MLPPENPPKRESFECPKGHQIQGILRKGMDEMKQDRFFFTCCECHVEGHQSVYLYMKHGVQIKTANFGELWAFYLSMASHMGRATGIEKLALGVQFAHDLRHIEDQAKRQCYEEGLLHKT